MHMHALDPILITLAQIASRLERASLHVSQGQQLYARPFTAYLVSSMQRIAQGRLTAAPMLEKIWELDRWVCCRVTFDKDTRMQYPESCPQGAKDL